MKLISPSPKTCKSYIPQFQGPIKTGAVVVHQFGIGNFSPNSINQFGHFAYMWIRSFDPQQIGAIFQTCDTIQDSPIESSIGHKFVESIGQTFWDAEFSIHFDEGRSIRDFVNVAIINFSYFQKAVIPREKMI